MKVSMDSYVNIFPQVQISITVTEQEIKFVMDRLNSRHRKTRNYKAPVELIMGQRVNLLAA
jgi:IS30 family transposase